MRARWFALCSALLFWLGVPTQQAWAQVDIIGAAQQEVQQESDENKAARDRRLAKLAEIQGRNDARVLVLKWPDSDVTEKNLIFQAMVKNRIGRPNAKFFPGIDLYQEGRGRRYDLDGTPVREDQQPGGVSNDELAEIRRRYETALRQYGSGTNNQDLADALLPLVDAVWFNDRAETRQLLFELYVAIGRSVSAFKYQVPPFFQMVGTDDCNYYLYLAAAMIWEERQAGGESVLAPQMPSGELGMLMERLIERIDARSHPPIPLAFHDQSVFDAEAFAGDHTVFINGMERVVDGKGYIEVPRGRIDVFLQRDDGYSLSDRVEVRRLDDKLYFVIDTARQKMGYDILEAVRHHPAECVAGIDRDAIRSLATYQALHPGSEVYVAIPWAGTAYDPYVWRWDPETSQLLLEEDFQHGFPVRFVLLSSTGLTFNNLSLSADAASARIQSQAAAGPAEITTPDVVGLAQTLPSFEMAGLPVDFQLRGHFNRLMFGFGVQFGANIAGPEGRWREKYQVQDDEMVVKRPDPEAEVDDLVDPDAATTVEEVYRELAWSRLIYGQLGVVLLKDAGAGIGPRGYLRVGWSNAPHVIDLTAHIGMTEDPSFGKKDYKGRVVPLIDLDLYSGMLIPFGQSLLFETLKDEEDPSKGYIVPIRPAFGFTLGAGFSF